MVEQRFTYNDLKYIAVEWADQLKESVKGLSEDWMDNLLRENSRD
jgi:hypothetical protein